MKNFKVITINGFRGIIAAIFIVCGLVAGFIISPGWVCMKLWNQVFEYSNHISTMNIYQGILLWSIIALVIYALNNKKALIGFGTCTGLSPDQIRDIMERTRKAEAKFIQELKEKKLEENSDENENTTTVSADDAEDIRK